jgi:hypothetical protein
MALDALEAVESESSGCREGSRLQPASSSRAENRNAGLHAGAIDRTTLNMRRF